jgi:hypothetical protein
MLRNHDMLGMLRNHDTNNRMLRNHDIDDRVFGDIKA